MRLLTCPLPVRTQNFGFEDVVEPMFEMGEETFQLPLEELLEYEMGDGGRTAGYKKVSKPLSP